MNYDPREEGVYPRRLLDYIATRRPVLMLSYEPGVAAELIKVREPGFVPDASTALSRMLVKGHAIKLAGELNILSAEPIIALAREGQAVVLSDVLEGLL